MLSFGVMSRPTGASHDNHITRGTRFRERRAKITTSVAPRAANRGGKLRATAQDAKNRLAWRRR
jgi:hypothetical protein